MASQAQWIPPLPAGFEARWDPNQRAYFFINHVTRQTTWVDPRFTPQPTQQTQHAAAAQQHPQPQRTPQKSLNPASMHATGGQGQNVAMGTMFKQFGSTTTRESGSSDNDDDDEWEDPTDFDKLFTSTTDEPAKVDLMKLQEIKQAFPTASEDLIKSLLIKHNNAVVRTTNDLFNQGHRRVAVRHPPPKMTDMLERLRAMFPDANPGLVEDMLSASENDEKNARKLLEEMGYTPTFPATHRNKSAQRQRSPSPAKPKTRSPSPSPVKKPAVSESEKQKRLRQLQNEMPSAEKSVIEMALQVCNYDVERTRNVLGRMTNDDSSRPGTSSASRPTTSSGRSTSPSTTLGPVSLEPASLEPASLGPDSLDPVSLFSDDSTSHTITSSGTHSSSGTSSRPSTARAKKSSTGSSSTGTTRSGTTGSGTTGTGSSRPSTSSRTRTPSPKKATTPSRQKQQHRAKQVTEMSKDILSSTIATLNRIGNNVSCCGQQPSISDDTESSSTVTKDTDQSSQSATDKSSNSQSGTDKSSTSQSESGTQQSHDSHDDDKSTNESSSSGSSIVSRQPQSRDVYISENRTQAQGPNPALRVGPNRNLLLDQYSLAKGPNAELRQGPDSTRVAGSQGATGPDRSHHCGPQLHLREGPSTENLLVTAI